MFHRLLGLSNLRSTSPMAIALVQFVRLTVIVYLLAVLLRIVLLPETGVFSRLPALAIPAFLVVIPFLLPWQRWIATVQHAQWFLWLTVAVFWTSLLFGAWRTGTSGWWIFPLLTAVFAPALVSLGMGSAPPKSPWALNRSQGVALVVWAMGWVGLWWCTLHGPGQHPHEAMLMARETFVALAVTLAWYVLLQASMCHLSLARTRYAFAVGYLILSVLFIIPQNAMFELFVRHSTLVARHPVSVWTWPVALVVAGLLWTFRTSNRVVPVSIAIALVWSVIPVWVNPALAFYILPAMAVLWLFSVRPQWWLVPIFGWVGTLLLFDGAPAVDRQQLMLHSLSGTAVFVLTVLLLFRLSGAETGEGQPSEAIEAAPRLHQWESRLATATGFGIGLLTPLFGISVVDSVNIPFMQAMALLGILLGLSGYASVRYLLEEQARQRILREVTVLRESDALRRRLELAMRVTGLGWFEMDRQKGTVTWDGKAAAIWGFPEYTGGHTLTLASLMALVHPDDLPLLKDAWDFPLNDTNGNQLEFRIFWRDGSEHWLKEQYLQEVDEQGQMLRRMGFVHEVTERKNLTLQLEELSKVDALTGLPNRRHLHAIAADEFDRSRRIGSTCVVAMVDVDHFKHVNDTYGHAIGDLLLKHLASVCRADLRKIDTIARLGGEEFVILMPHTDEATAVAVLDRLRFVLQSSALILEDGREVAFTVSIGITSQKPDETDFDVVLKRADAAMYEAKRLGRNQVRLG